MTKYKEAKKALVALGFQESFDECQIDAKDEDNTIGKTFVKATFHKEKLQIVLTSTAKEDRW